MKYINKYKSPNFNNRFKGTKIRFIIIHYTAIYSLNETILLLCNKRSKVSCHFLISKNGLIYQLVEEKYRAWHAGKSYWKGIKDINSNSIGIEIQNSGHFLNFENYTHSQIVSLIKLLKHLKKKYNITKNDILGHSDIAPMRKKDPGEKFPWKELNKKGLIYLPKIQKIHKNKENNFIKIKSIKRKLKKIGYQISINNKNDKIFKNTIKAFQMHYQQDFVKGYPNYMTFYLIDELSKRVH